MKRLVHEIERVAKSSRSLLGRLLKVARPRARWLRKARILRDYEVSILEHPILAARYIAWDPELTNFSYRISNEIELVRLIAEETGRTVQEVEVLRTELESDELLRNELRGLLKSRPDKRQEPLFGRRLGWYILARLFKPEVAVETGIHDGLGSSVLLRALHRNGQEGSPGRLISIDIDPQSGWLVPSFLRPSWERVIGSTFDTLPLVLAERQVGLIVHDSVHTYECERFEFAEAVRRAAPELVLISDNAHVTDALKDQCRRLNIPFCMFKERPVGTFYPGAGMGFGVYRSDRQA